MGTFYAFKPEPVDPPEEDLLECPECGAKLHMSHSTTDLTEIRKNGIVLLSDARRAQRERLRIHRFRERWSADFPDKPPEILSAVDGLPNTSV